MAKKFTEVGLERLSKNGIYWDAGQTGLGIKVTPAGRKIWKFQIRYPGQRSQSRRTLGHYPGLSLTDARAKAADWYQLVKQGIDPEEALAEERRNLEAARRADSPSGRFDLCRLRRAVYSRAVQPPRQTRRPRNSAQPSGRMGRASDPHRHAARRSRAYYQDQETRTL